MCEAILYFLNDGNLGNGMNFTYVALIPKCVEPKRVGGLQTYKSLQRVIQDYCKGDSYRGECS